MQILFFVLIGLFVIITFLIVIGLFLNQNIVITESVTIEKESAVVFPEIADLKKFVSWSPWSNKDPLMRNYFEGEKMTPGAKYSWEGNNKVGKGSMTIAHLEVNELIIMELDFGFQNIAKCSFQLEKETLNNTKVTWTMESSTGRNPLRRWVGFLMKNLVSRDFKTGLNNLKQKLEKS